SYCFSAAMICSSLCPFFGMLNLLVGPSRPSTAYDTSSLDWYNFRGLGHWFRLRIFPSPAYELSYAGEDRCPGRARASSSSEPGLRPQPALLNLQHAKENQHIYAAAIQATGAGARYPSELCGLTSL